MAELAEDDSYPHPVVRRRHTRWNVDGAPVARHSRAANPPGLLSEPADPGDYGPGAANFRWVVHVCALN